MRRRSELGYGFSQKISVEDVWVTLCIFTITLNQITLA